MNDEDAQDDPIVPPTDERLGSAGDERIVMHAGAENGKSAFPAKGVIDGKEEGARGREDACDEQGEVHAEDVDVPDGVAEEAMKAGPMTVVDIAAGEDDIGDVAASMGEGPAGTDLPKGLESRLGENGRELG
jgi:hypothetical protein